MAIKKFEINKTELYFADVSQPRKFLLDCYSTENRLTLLLGDRLLEGFVIKLFDDLKVKQMIIGM
jgi:hypothetical protein